MECYSRVLIFKSDQAVFNISLDLCSTDLSWIHVKINNYNISTYTTYYNYGANPNNSRLTTPAVYSKSHSTPLSPASSRAAEHHTARAKELRPLGP